MLKSVTLAMVLCVGLLLAMAAPAMAQSVPGYTPGTAPYSVNPYSSPPVSPYVNLGYNTTNGLSNYQTMVRPMIDEREAISRQAATIQQLQQQLRQGPGSGGKDARRQEGPSRSAAGYFMQYSHYYGTRR